MKYFKRYQYLGPLGIQWSKWFPCKERDTEEKVQLKGKLINQYKRVK